MFDKNFQDKVLASMIAVPEFASVASQHLTSSEFDGPMAQNMALMATDFWKKYESVLTSFALVENIKSLVAKGTIQKTEGPLYGAEFKRLKAIDTSDWKFTLDRLIAFVKHQKIRVMIDGAVKKHLPKEDFQSIEKMMDEIKAITALHEVKGYDYWGENEIKEREQVRKEEALMRQIGISTGIKRLDEVLHKQGFYKKELYVFLAPPKRGKSMSLLFFSNQASLQGKNVAHFTCEVSREVCAARLDAMNADIPSKQLNERAGRVASAVLAGVPSGKVFFFEYPTKCLSAQEMERQIKSLKIEKGINIDMICVDYLDILKPSRHGADKYEDQGSISDELRAMAWRCSCPVVTASQVNRAGAGKQLIGGTDVAGSFEKIMVADEIITISATDEELAQGIARLHFSQSRNSGTATITIETAFDRGRFYKNYVDDVV